MTITQVLVWLAGVGCVAAASWILERIPKYVALLAEAKRWIFFGVASVIAISAQLINVYVPVEVIQTLAPYFATMVYVFSYVFFGTAFHKIDKLQ